VDKIIPFPKTIRQITTEELKKLWSSDEEGEWTYEEIHAELNKRGEGEYCAV